MSIVSGLREDDYFNEDFARGAVTSLQLSITRIKCRASDGIWPEKRIGKYRQEMEDQIERLIDEEIERRRRLEITSQEREGRAVIHRHRRGRNRMVPQKK